MSRPAYLIASWPAGVAGQRPTFEDFVFTDRECAHAEAKRLSLQGLEAIVIPGWMYEPTEGVGGSADRESGGNRESGGTEGVGGNRPTGGCWAKRLPS